MAPEFQRVLHITSFEEEERKRPTLRYWLSRRHRSALRLWSFCGGRSMDLAPDFDEFIASLTAHGVEFVIVGAYALADRVQGPLGRHSVAFLSQSRGD